MDTREAFWNIEKRKGRRKESRDKEEKGGKQRDEGKWGGGGMWWGEIWGLGLGSWGGIGAVIKQSADPRTLAPLSEKRTNITVLCATLFYSNFTAVGVQVYLGSTLVFAARFHVVGCGQKKDAGFSVLLRLRSFNLATTYLKSISLQRRKIIFNFFSLDSRLYNLIIYYKSKF